MSDTEREREFECVNRVNHDYIRSQLAVLLHLLQTQEFGVPD